MKISFDRPPLWDKIDAAFHVNGRPVIFAWGDTIFNPERVPITKELHAHEEVHGQRQLNYAPDRSKSDSEELWWLQYIKDHSFRLAEEIPAHAAEYRAYCKRHSGTSGRRRALTLIAGKLASPLYGSLITLDAAIDAIVIGKEA